MDTINLTEAEWKIMVLLWEKAPKTITQLTHALENQTGWTKHTIISLLRRMAEKGTVRVEDTGRVKLFYPLAEKDSVAKEQTQTLLSRLFNGNPMLLMHTMVERGDLTEEDLAELSALIEKKRGEV